MAQSTIAILVLLSVLAPCVRAAPRVEARAVRSGRRIVGLLLINRRPAAHVLTVFGGQSPVARARSAAQRLRGMLAAGHPVRSLAVRRTGSRWSVMAPGGAVILSVTRAEARAQRSRPPDLARRWAARMRSLLALPVVSLATPRILVPLGESRSVRIGGIAEGGFRVDLPVGADVAHASLQRRYLIVTGLAVGRAQVAVSAEDSTARCHVIVKKYAGRLDALIEAQVTGSPAPPSLVASAAALAIRRYLPVEPGASVSLLAPPDARRALDPGRSAIVTAKARIAGGDHIPIEGSVRVMVSDRELPEGPAARLFYSNSPERIIRAATLFSGRLDVDAPARLFYHHINGTGRVLALHVILVNHSLAPVTLQIVPGFAPSDADAVRAGHLAGRVFFPRLLRNVGAIYTLPGRSSVPMAIHRLSPDRTASGMAEVRLLSPGTCSIRVAAEPWAACSWPGTISRPDAWRTALPRAATVAELADRAASPDIYPQSAKQVDAEYTIGKPWTWIHLGKEPIADAHGDRHLDGNYGVVYRIRVHVRNPEPERRSVEVAFEAGAGQASGVFAIGGRYVEVPSVLPLQERSLARFDVGPHQTRAISIETVPLGGSSYPASLIVR